MLRVRFNSPEDALRQLKQRLIQTPEALILIPFLISWEFEYIQAMLQEQALTILPFTQFDPLDGSRWFFHFPGLKAQILALLQSTRRDDYTRLQIEHHSDNTLSVALHDYAKQVARKLKFTVKKADQSLAALQPKSARLWLKPVNKDKVDPQFRQNELMLAPGFFFTQQQTNSVHNRSEFRRWRVAYPYVPDQRDNAIWQAVN